MKPKESIEEKAIITLYLLRLWLCGIIVLALITVHSITLTPDYYQSIHSVIQLTLTSSISYRLLVELVARHYKQPITNHRNKIQKPYQYNHEFFFHIQFKSRILSQFPSSFFFLSPSLFNTFFSRFLHFSHPD